MSPGSQLRSEAVDLVGIVSMLNAPVLWDAPQLLSQSQKIWWWVPVGNAEVCVCDIWEGLVSVGDLEVHVWVGPRSAEHVCLHKFHRDEVLSHLLTFSATVRVGILVTLSFCQIEL